MADHSSELPLGNQQTRADPTLDLIAWLPAFHVAADRLDDGKRRLDHIRAARSRGAGCRLLAVTGPRYRPAAGSSGCSGFVRWRSGGTAAWLVVVRSGIVLQATPSPFFLVEKTHPRLTLAGG